MAKARKSRKTQQNASPAIVTTAKNVTSTRKRQSVDVSAISNSKAKQARQSAPATTTKITRSAMTTRKRHSEVSDDDSSTSNASKAKRTRKSAPAVANKTTSARATKGRSDDVSFTTKSKQTRISAPAATTTNSTVTLRRSARLSAISSRKVVTEAPKSFKQKGQKLKATTQTPKDATKTGTAKVARKARSARVSSTNKAKPKQTTPKSTPKKKEKGQAKRKASKTKSVALSVSTPEPASSASSSSSGSGSAGTSARAQRVQRFNEAREIGLAKAEEAKLKKERAKMARERASPNAASASFDHDRELVAPVPEAVSPSSGEVAKSYFASSSASTSGAIFSFQLALVPWKGKDPSSPQSEEEVNISQLGYCNSSASSTGGDDCSDPLALSPPQPAAAAAAAGPMSPLAIQQGKAQPQAQALVPYSAVPPSSEFEPVVPCSSSQSLASTFTGTGSGLPISDADMINFVLNSESEGSLSDDDGSISDTEIISVPVRTTPHPARHAEAETQCNLVDVDAIHPNNSSRVFGGRRGRSRSQSRQRFAAGNNPGSSCLLGSVCPMVNPSLTQIPERLPGDGVLCPGRVPDADPRT